MLTVKLDMTLEDAQALEDILNVYPSHPLANEALMGPGATLYAYVKLCKEQALRGAPNELDNAEWLREANEPTD